MVKKPITVRRLSAEDVDLVREAVRSVGWDNKVSLYDRYLSEQEDGERVVLLAFWDDLFAGYLTVCWQSHYPSFRAANIPEIVDFNVLPNLRRRGVGSRLMDEAEAVIATRSLVAGIGVGLGPNYGPAQRLYALRGYVPDGLEVWYKDHRAGYGERVAIDDDLVIYLTKQLRQSL